VKAPLLIVRSTTSVITSQCRHIGETKIGHIIVMVIEDERSLANLYALMLSQMGVHPEICRDGQKARDRIAEGLSPGLLLLDLYLPKVDGEQLLKDIESNPEYDNTRIVIVTAYPDLGQRLMEQDRRVRRVLTKPLELSDLKEEVKNLRSDSSFKPK
jgi:DNA-binding response OmpR family regulator